MGKNSPRLPFTQWLSTLFMIGLLTAGCQANQIQQTPPPGFQQVAAVDLSAQAYDEEIVGQFTLAETAITTIFYTLQNIDTTEFDLRLRGPNEEYLMLHSEDFRTDENGGGTWERSLAPSDYQVVLTTPQISGTLSVYWQQK